MYRQHVFLSALLSLLYLTHQVAASGSGSIIVPMHIVPMSRCYPQFVTDTYPSACQYSADFTFGDGKEQVSLLLDPGSSLLAVVQEDYVPTENAVDLSSNDTECDIIRDPSNSYGGIPNGSECAIYSSYQDGSSFFGYAVNDAVHFVGQSEDLVFGVTTSRENAPNDVNDNGIAGVDRGKISVTSQLYDADDIEQFSFGQCGTSPLVNGSFGVFGSYLPTSSYTSIKLYTGVEMSSLNGLGEAFDTAVLNIDGDTHRYYVLFSGVEINGNRVQNASYSSLPMLFDTGTPAMILPSEYFDAIAAHVNATVSNFGGQYVFVEENLPFVGDAILVVPMSGVLDASVVGEIFPNITVLLGEDQAGIVLPPESYVMSAEFEGAVGFSVKFSSLGTSETLDEADGINLGTPIVYNRFVQVNSETSSMHISDWTPECGFPDEPDEELSASQTASTSGATTLWMSCILCFSILLLY